MVLARISLAMRRSGSAENKPDKTTWNTSGLTPVVSTRQISPNSRRLSTPCFAGTATRLDAMSIYRMFLALPSTPTRSLTYGRGNRISRKADGLLGVGHSKSFWLPLRSNFSREKVSGLGDKRSLKQQIHEITGIADSALQGAALSQFRREEDKAYSLLGIFDVYMPLIYGEGEENAFKRLRTSVQMVKEDQECIQHLRLTDPRDDKKRIEET
jgi:hypothetical protein